MLNDLTRRAEECASAIDPETYEPRGDAPLWVVDAWTVTTTPWEKTKAYELLPLIAVSKDVEDVDFSDSMLSPRWTDLMEWARDSEGYVEESHYVGDYHSVEELVRMAQWDAIEDLCDALCKALDGHRGTV